MSIQMGELIAVGEIYHSRVGNVIHIIEEKEAIEKKEKRTSHFRGIIIDTIAGHEILLNRAHWFNSKGKWLKYPGGIHDLVKLCTLHDNEKETTPDKPKEKEKPKDKSKKK
jgi:hypothetical protein